MLIRRTKKHTLTFRWAFLLYPYRQITSFSHMNYLANFSFSHKYLFRMESIKVIILLGFEPIAEGLLVPFCETFFDENSIFFQIPKVTRCNFLLCWSLFFTPVLTNFTKTSDDNVYFEQKRNLHVRIKEEGTKWPIGNLQHVIQNSSQMTLRSRHVHK